MNKRAIIVVATAMLVLLPLMASVPHASAATPSLSLTPSTVVVSTSKTTFNLTLTVTGVTNLWSWKAEIAWDPAVLNLTRNPIEGPFLKGAGTTLFLFAPINRTSGIIPEMSSTILGSTSASGNGTLTYLTFQVLNATAYDTTTVNLVSTILLDTSQPHNYIAHTHLGATVITTIVGDVNGDFKVTILDVVGITGIYGSKQGEPGFNPNADLNGDGKITILDVVTCTGRYGQHWP
jgi:hypothetical protein